MSLVQKTLAWRFEEEDGANTPAVVVNHMIRYGELLQLLEHPLQTTSSRRVFGRWLGRRIPSAYGGAYVYLVREQTHAILINLGRINHHDPKALEIVVAEELIHMRDWIDGDRRGHARHGHDRIAHRVANITDTSLEQVRNALVPVKPRPYRYLYQCPNCKHEVPRKRRGTWACRPCYEATGRRIQLQLIATAEELHEQSGANVD